jgi:hypothetical protein
MWSLSWNDNEKNTGICDFCRNFGRDKNKCMKCGRVLWNYNEKTQVFVIRVAILEEIKINV